MSIADLPEGAVFIVRRVSAGREVGKRLVDMGFTEGARGKIVRKSFFAGPFHVEIRGYDVMIRRSEAALIDIEEGSSAEGSEDAR